MPAGVVMLFMRRIVKFPRQDNNEKTGPVPVEMPPTPRAHYPSNTSRHAARCFRALQSS